MNDRKYFYMNAAELMDSAFDVYKKSFWRQIIFSVQINLIAVLLIFGVSLVGALGIGIIGIAGGLGTVLLYIVVLAAIFAVGVWSAVTRSGSIIISRQEFLYGGNGKGVISQIFAALPRIASVVLAQFLVSIPIMLLFGFLLYIAVSFAGATTDYSSIPYAYSPFAYLSSPRFATFVALIVVFIILIAMIYLVFNTCFAMSIPIALFERGYFFNALAKSLKLIRGHFWRVLGINLVWTVIVTMLYYSILMIFSIASSLMDFAVNQPQLEPFAIATALSAMQYVAPIFFQAAMAPFSGILSFIIYFNQKINKDGIDIELGIERLKKKKAEARLPAVSESGIYNE